MIKGATGLERAKLLHELIDTEAADSERLGRLTDAAASALLQENLFSQLLPSTLGGFESSLAQFFETVEEVASADGSAGWCLSVCSATNLMAHKGITARAREEIFGAGPVAVWTSLLPRATSEPADGGFLVSGKFGWGSGSSLANWVLIAEPLEDRDGMQWFRAHVVPKSEVTIVPDSWRPMGLRATASADYEIDGVFVPAHRSFEYPLMDLDGSHAISTLASTTFHQVGMTGFASGVASRAIAELVSAAAKVQKFGTLASQAEDEVTQQGLGEVLARHKAARGNYLAVIAEQDDFIARHGRPSREISLNSIPSAVVLAQASRNAAIFAFDGSATGSLMTSDPIQRCLRDIFAGLKHPTFNSNHFRQLGKVTMGIDPVPIRLK